MIRAALSLLLASILAVQTAPLSAQDTAPNPKLQDLIRNLPDELERFGKLHPLPMAEKRSLSPDIGGANEAEDARLVRARLLNLPPDTTMVVVELRNGEQAKGQLVEIGEESFVLKYPGKEKRELTLDEVESVDFQSQKWRAPQRVREIPIGKKVEVHLLNGQERKGRLDATHSDGFIVSSRSLTFEEVAYIGKPGGMPTWAWVPIIAGGVFGGLLIFCAAGGCER